MRKFSTHPFLFFLFLFLLPFISIAQVAGDYRSVATGNWNSVTSWQVRDGSGNWSAATVLPIATNNVYIQNGHTLTLDITVLPNDGAAFDLHINTLGVLAISSTNNIKVSGKIRCYTGAAETSPSDGIYLGASSTVVVASMITTTSSGLLKFIGGTRVITNTGEWSSAGANNLAEFALDAGAIGTLTVGCKFKNIIFSSGIISTASFISATNGDLTIKAGARLISARSGVGNAIIANSSSSKCDVVTIEAGGILELTGSAPTIDCTTFTNNGTVIYSRAGTQTLLQKAGGDATATAALGSYSTLILSNTNSKTPTIPITVSNLLQFTGTATLAATATNSLTMFNNATVDRSAVSGTSLPSAAGAVFYGTTATDLVNVTIGNNLNNSNELPSAPTPGKVGTLTINPSVIYQITGSRTVNNIANNGQIIMVPGTSLTLTITGTLAGTGVFSTKMSTLATPPSTTHFAGALTFTGAGPVGTLYMKQEVDSNHLRALTVNSAGGLILGNTIIVDTTLTLTNGILTNASNLTLGTDVRINRAAGSLSAVPNFGTSVFNLTYNGSTATTTGLEMPTTPSTLKSLTIFNATGVTLNSSPIINDTLKLLLGNLIIPATQTLRIISGIDISGAPFSNTKYIVSGLSGASTGALRIDNITAAKLFPIGTATNYLPVLLTPSATMDYQVSVFTGATTNGLPNGTPLNAAQKDRLVDAVWTINRLAGSGNCDVQTNWEASLEGTAFNSFANASIGIARNNGTTWDAFIGTGDNIANTATASFSSFSPFLVGELATVLPVTLKSVSAFVKVRSVEIHWKVENEISILKYEVEKSINGFDFFSIGKVDAANKNNYNFTDASTLLHVYYYRIKMINTNGSFKYSNIINVKQSSDVEVSIYPNPVANSLVINGLISITTITVTNTIGQVVLQQASNANALSIDVTALKQGIYVIQFVSKSGERLNKTFIKK